MDLNAQQSRDHRVAVIHFDRPARALERLFERELSIKKGTNPSSAPVVSRLELVILDADDNRHFAAFRLAVNRRASIRIMRVDVRFDCRFDF
jgi:hypothetical protein